MKGWKRETEGGRRDVDPVPPGRLTLSSSLSPLTLSLLLSLSSLHSSSLIFLIS